MSTGCARAATIAKPRAPGYSIITAAGLPAFPPLTPRQEEIVAERTTSAAAPRPDLSGLAAMARAVQALPSSAVLGTV